MHDIYKQAGRYLTAVMANRGMHMYELHSRVHY
jgi:hypothetical protein